MRRSRCRLRVFRVRYGVCLPLLALAACTGPEGARSYIGEESVLRLLMPPTPAEAAELATDPYDPNKRYRGTLSLANDSFVDATPFIELFEARIQDEDARVRSAGARGLANHGRPRHATMLVAALEDTEPVVRREAARGLQRIHNPQVIPRLVRAVDHEVERDVEVRIEAAYALGQYADNRVFEALKKALRDRNLAVNFAAAESLHNLTGEDFGPSITAWEEWGDETPNRFAGQREYHYPVFQRPRRLLEYLPLVPQPPNEQTATPAGLPRLDR